MSYDANLRQLPLFANLPPQHLEWAREAMRVMRVEPGENVFNQDDEANGMYLFLSGRGRLIRQHPDGRQQVLGEVGPNQYLNEAALFRKGIETASLVVTETASILYISRHRLQRVVSYHPEMKKYLPIPVETVRAQQREKAFHGQRDSEELLLDTRRHWWAFARQAWLPGIVAILLFIASTMMPVPLLGWVVAGLAAIVPGVLVIYLYLEWRNDQVIVTDQRLIRIERVILTLQEHRSEIPLSSIQEINADNIVPSDLFSRIFDYGTVKIRTAGQGGNLILDLIPDPEGVQDLIFENRNRYRQVQEAEHRNMIRAEVDRVIAGEAPQGFAEEEASVYIAHPPRGFLPMRYTNADGDTVYRKHWFYYFRRVFLPSLMMLSSFGLLLIAYRFGFAGYVATAAVFTVGLLWYWWVDWDWRHDLYVVGDEMIQFIHKRPLFLRSEEDQVLLERVDNVTAWREGIIQTMLNYGTVKISLVGGDRGEEKRFPFISNPSAVQEEITRRQQRWRSRQDSDSERRRREEIAEYLAVYHETNRQRGGEMPAPQNPVPPAQRQTPEIAPRPPRIPRKRH